MKDFSNIKIEVENLKKKIGKQTSVIAKKDNTIEDLRTDLKNYKSLYISSNKTVDEYRNVKIELLKKISKISRNFNISCMINLILLLILIWRCK